ncbi:DNA-binding transcriptional ArsR family regulator [Marisediminicola sp. UYEF4]
MFRALDDGTRRLILDELAARDGQTLFELCALAGISQRWLIARKETP